MNRATLKTLAKWLVMAVALGLLAFAVAQQWADVSRAVTSVGLLALVAATALAFAALLANASSWRAVMASLGLNVTWREAAGVFFVSQVGKYVPGAIWPVVAQTEFAKAHGMSRSRAATGSLVAMAVGVVMAGVVGGVTLAVFSPGGLTEYWWALAIAFALAVTLVPAVLTRLLSLALKVLRRPGEPPRIGARALLVAAAFSGLNWLLLGAQAWVLLRPLAPSASIGIATGAFALAWLAGFLAVFAPAGLGVREGALVVSLAGVAARPDALALAVLSRFALTLADVAAWALGVTLRRGPQGKPSHTFAP